MDSRKMRENPMFYHLKAVEEPKGQFEIVEVDGIDGEEPGAKARVRKIFSGRFKNLADKLFGMGIAQEKIMEGKKMCGIACMSPKGIKKNEYVYNFCMGNNYSETGDPLKVPDFLVQMYKNYEHHISEKGGEIKK